MTNDEAICVLKNTAWLGWDKQKEKVTEAVKMTVEALKAQLSKEDATSDLQQTCNQLATDAISRQAVRFIETNSDSYPEEWNDDYEKGFTDALNKVIALPSVQPEIIRCKDCKHWKDSDGVYRRGIGAESKCPMNIWPVYDGVFYCGYAERRTDEGD